MPPNGGQPSAEPAIHNVAQGIYSTTQELLTLWQRVLAITTPLPNPNCDTQWLLTKRTTDDNGIPGSPVGKGGQRKSEPMPSPLSSPGILNKHTMTSPKNKKKKQLTTPTLWEEILAHCNLSYNQAAALQLGLSESPGTRRTPCYASPLRRSFQTSPPQMAGKESPEPVPGEVRRKRQWAWKLLRLVLATLESPLATLAMGREGKGVPSGHQKRTTLTTHHCGPSLPASENINVLFNRVNVELVQPFPKSCGHEYVCWCWWIIQQGTQGCPSSESPCLVSRVARLRMSICVLAL